MRRIVSITKAFATETAKRLPWIILLLGVLIIAQNIQDSKVRNQNQTVLLKKIASQSEDIKRLSEQNHALSQQAIVLSNRSVQQVDCVKQLFVDYINTRKPIASVDSDACTVVGAGGTASSSNQPQSKPQLATPPSQKPTNPKPPTPPTNPQDKPVRGLLNRLLHFIGLG